MIVSAAAIVGAFTLAPPTDAASRNDASSRPPLPLVRISTSRYAAQLPVTGQTVTVYGPQQFKRTAGAPNVFTATIVVPAGVGAPFTLKVRNGDAAGGYRVTAADLEVNGVRVAVPSTFGTATSGFDAAVSLGASNTLRVTLRGTPGSYLTLSIEGRTLDRTPPRLTVIAPPPDAVISTRTPQLVIGYADPASDGGPSGVDVTSLVVQVDGVDRTSLFTRGAEQATAQLTAAQAVADGPHVVVASIADRAGNVGSATARFVVDGTAPSIETIEPPPGRFINTTTPTIRIQYNDRDGVDLSTLRVLINGIDRTALFTKGATEAVAILDAASALPQGMVEVASTIRDVGGNAAASTSSFVVDTEMPAIEIVQPGLDQYTSAAAIDVSGSVTDASPATVTVNGVDASVSGSNFTAANVPIGSGPDVDVIVLATDAAGNTARTSRVVHVDRDAPVVHIDQPAAGAFVGSAAIAVSGTVSDASTVVVRVNGVSATVGSGSFTVTVPATDGPTTLQAVAEDAAGNTAAFSLAVTVDTVTPQVTIATPAAGSVLRGPVVTVTGTVADATPTVVLVNGVPAIVSGAAFSAAVPVPDGAVTLAVVARDAAGNAATAAAAITVDSVAPALRLTAPAAGSSTNAAAVHITGTVADATAVTLMVAGVDVPVVSGQFAYDAVVANEGDATITAVATDAAGNTATAFVTVTVDRSAPTVSIVTPASGSFLRGPSVAITGTVADAAIASVNVNGVPAVLADGGFSALVPVNDGQVTLVATATDRAGNSAIAAANVTVDTVPPTISVVVSTDGATPARPQFVFTTSDNVAIDPASFSAFVDGQPMLFTVSSIGPSQYTFVGHPGIDLVDGEHTYSAVIADRCGNTAAITPQVYTVHLAPAGTIRGRLLAADGVTPVGGQVVTASGPSVRSAMTAADGSFQFDREDLGTYTLSATLANGSRAKADGVLLAANGDVVSVDLVAIAIGSVTVTVSTTDGTAVSPSVVVTLHSLHPVFGFFASATPARGTTVTFASVPVGDFTVTAADPVRLYRGDASGTISRDGQSIAIAIQMANGVVTLPATLADANNFQFGVQPNGSVTGTNNAFSTGRFGALLDIVSGDVATRFGGAATAQVEQNRRQFTVQQTGIAGLDVTRKIFVPADGYFSRYLEVLSNSTASPITVDVRVTSTMKAPNAQRAVVTSSGDAIVSVADPVSPDRWVVANDTQTSDPNLVSAAPALAFVFDGDGGARRVDNLTFTPDAVGQLVEQWSSVTIPAGGQAAFMHFVVMQMDAASATASAARLVTLPQEALAGLTASDIATIQNFAVPANAVSAVPALRLGGRISGTVFGADSVAPVPAATVTLRSVSPYYRRAYTVTTPATGAFSFTQTVGSAAGNIAVPIDGFTVQATSGSIQSPPTSGALSASQTAAVANVAFTNAGVIRGTVRRHTGLAATGSTTLYLFNASTSITSLASSTYLLPVVAPGAFTLEAQTSHPQGSALDGTRAGSIAAGESLTFDVILPPTGTVSGRTIVSGGAASPFGTVTIAAANGFTRRTQADGSGVYTLTDVPVGVYTFSATQFSTNVAADTVSISVAVDATTTQDAVFPGKGTVTGTVMFANGATIASGVQVDLFGTGITPRSTKSNASGVYTFTDVPTGRPFTVRATSPSNAQLYRDVSASLSGDGQVLTLNIVLPASATVLVTVVAPFTPPVAVQGSSVTLVDAIGATSVGISDASGQVAFANVPEGSFAVTATDPDRRRGLAVGRGAVTLADQGGTVAIQLVQPFIASVAGHVYGADGRTPIADARVSALVADRSVDAFSGPDGSYAIANVSPDGGALTLRVDSPFTFAPVATRTFTIDADGQQVTADFSLPYAAIRGLVTFGDGQRSVPSPSVTVTQAGPDGFPVNYNATSDDFGHYTFVGLVLGDFSVTAQDTATGLTGTASARIESLDAGANRDVALQPSGTVTGTVRNAAGLVAGASVSLTSTGLNLQRFTVTDADGRYRVDDVALGVVTVRSFVQPFTFVSQGELSSMGQVVTVDLAPPPAGTLTGTVRDAFGAPVVGALVFIEDALGTASTSTLTGDNGAYSATWLPGPVRVTALRTSDVLNAGAAETTLAPGATVTLDVALGNAVYAFARMPLPSADGFIYKVECDGSIAAGGTADGRLSSPYSAKSYAMSIDGVGPGCRRSLLLEDNRQEVVAGPESDGQVTVTRKTFVPAAGSFVRMIDSVTNPTAADITVTMVVTATLPSSTSTRVVVAPGPSTPYAVTDGGGKPALAHVFGDGKSLLPSATHVAAGDSQLSYRWTVTIPAGQTISVMHFSAQRDVADSAGATAAAQALSALTVPDALAGLTNDERARIINFRVP